MNDREELMALRRLAELEAKAAGQGARRRAALPQSLANIEADQAGYSPVSDMSGPERVAAGVGQAVVNVGRGLGQMLPRGPMGMAGPMVTPRNVADARALDAPLDETTGGKAGNFAANVAMAIPAAFVPGANSVVGSGVIGAGLGLMQPAESVKEKVTQGAVGLVAGAGGQKAGQMIGREVASRSAARAASAAERQAENAVRDATIRESRRAGYVLPPATINQGSRGAGAAESLSGKAATAQTVAYRNQRVTNRLVREDLGLRGARQTSPAELKAIRESAGRVYDSVSKSGRIVPDQQYLDEVANLSSVLDDVAAEFPGATAPSADKIRQLADSLFQQDFDAGAAVKYIRSLREQAKANFKAVAAAGGNAEGLAMARAQQEAAGILEDMMIRHLRATGRVSLADSFGNARVLIAKAHDAEVALNPATGNIDATKLGGMLRRGRPLGGNFETVGKFAAAFRESAREQATGPGVSALSAVLSTGAGIGGLVSGNPAVLAASAIPFARGAARQAILTGPAQAMAMPSYSASSPLLQMLRNTSPFAAPVGIGIANTE